jgi:hypothetical protein
MSTISISAALLSQVMSQTATGQSRDYYSVSSLSSEETKRKQTKSMCSTTPQSTKSHLSQSVRGGIRAQNIVHCESDEPFNLKAEGIVKIFISDNEFIEVTHEQEAARVKTSSFIGKRNALL